MKDINKQIEVEIEFKDTMKDIVYGFLVCSNKLDVIDDYVIGDNELTEKGIRLIKNNLIDTENPHHQIRKQIQLKMSIHNFPRFGVYELDRHVVGKKSYQYEHDFFDTDNVPTITSTRYSLHHIAQDEDVPEILENIKMESMSKYEKLVAKYYYIPEYHFSEIEEREQWIYNRMQDLSNIKFYKNMYHQTNDELKKYTNEYLYANTIYCKCTGEWLYNFLKQRLDKSANFIIRDLSKKMYEAIPDNFKDIFKVYKYKKIDIKIMDSIKKDIEILQKDNPNNILINKVVNDISIFLSKNLVEKEYLV